MTKMAYIVVLLMAMLSLSGCGALIGAGIGAGVGYSLAARPTCYIWSNHYHHAIRVYC